MERRDLEQLVDEQVRLNAAGTFTPGGTEVVLLGPGEDVILRRLAVHLKPFLRSRSLTAWIAGPTTGGTELAQHLDAAALVIAVLGPEMPYELATELASRAAHRRVVPVRARPYDEKSSPLRHLAAIPYLGPISSYRDQDEALVEVVDGVKYAVGRP